MLAASTAYVAPIYLLRISISIRHLEASQLQPTKLKEPSLKMSLILLGIAAAAVVVYLCVALKRGKGYVTSDVHPAPEPQR